MESEINDRQERQRSGDFSPRGEAACRARRRGRSYCIRTIRSIMLAFKDTSLSTHLQWKIEDRRKI